MPVQAGSTRHEAFSTRSSAAESYRAFIASTAALERGDTRAAVQYLREALVHDPASPLLHRAIADAYAQLGLDEDAREHIALALNSDPNDARAYLSLAYLDEKSGGWQSAKQSLQKAATAAGKLSKTDKNWRALRDAAERRLLSLYIEHHQQNTDTEVNKLLQAADLRVKPHGAAKTDEKERTSAAMLLYTATYTSAEQGLFSKAAAYLETLQRQYPSTEAADEGLSLSLSLAMAQGDYPAALQAQKKLVDGLGDTMYARSMQLLLLAMQNRTEEANIFAQNWLDEDDSTRVRLIIADAWQHSGDALSAEKWLLHRSSSTVDIPARRPELRLYMADQLLQRRQLSVAWPWVCAEKITVDGTALDTTPTILDTSLFPASSSSNPDTYKNKNTDKNTDKNTSKSTGIKTTDKKSKKNNKTPALFPVDWGDLAPRAAAQCAKIEVEMGHWHSAQKRLEQAITYPVDPQHPSWSVLDTYRQLATQNNAPASFDQNAASLRVQVLLEDALKKDPEDDDIFGLLLQLHQDRGRVDVAQNLLQEALKGRPLDRRLHTLSARVAENTQNYRAAAEILQRFLDRASESTDVLNYLAFMLAESEWRTNDAVAYAQKAVVQNPLNGYIADTLGWAQVKAQQIPQAIKTLERANRLVPNEAEILFHLATAYKAAGNVIDSQKTATRAKELCPPHETLYTRITSLLLDLSQTPAF